MLGNTSYQLFVSGRVNKTWMPGEPTHRFRATFGTAIFVALYLGVLSMPRLTLAALQKGSGWKHVWLARVVAVLIGVSIASSAAYGTIVPLAGDSFVSSNRPTVNFGTLANLYVGNGNTALLFFDPSLVLSGVASNQIAQATLTIFVNRVNTGGTVSLSPVTSALGESGMALLPAATYDE